MMKRLKVENFSFSKPHNLKLRRALFEDNKNEIDSDLECIVPLNLELVDNMASVSKQNLLLDSINNDYDILEVIQNNNTGIKSPKENCKMSISECMSPLFLSPQKSFNELSRPCNTSTSNFKSLQESTNVTPTLTTSNSDSSSLSLKRKLLKNSPSITKKLAKINDNTHSKVRTELFPIIDIALPTSSFYPKVKEKIHKSEYKLNQIRPVSTISKPRQTKQKKPLAVINAGVRHNIKKPKQRRINKRNMKNLDIEDKYALHNYLMDIEKIAEPVKKLIKNKENCLIDLPIDYISNQTNKTRPDYETFEDIEIIGDDLAINVNSLINSLGKNSGLEDPCSENKILSPTTQMCNMASEMGLCSPKKRKNLSNLLASMKEDNISHISNPKLFPVSSVKNILEVDDTHIPQKSDFKNVHIDSDQMLLDAGQKNFGATQCDKCELLFHVGEPSDENIHSKYHSAQPIRFSGWKDERIVGIYGDSRIIKILPTDSKAWWTKAVEVMNYIDKGLKPVGNFEFDHLEQVYFYIKNKEVIGCLTAVPRNSAFKMISAVNEIIDLGSEETYPIKCGVSRLWVYHKYDNIDIAKSLLQVLKSTFVQGGILNDFEIAFNSSTDIRKYFKPTQFLIYS